MSTSVITASPLGATLRGLVRACAILATLGLPALAQDEAPPSARMAEVREIGRVLLVSRAAERREIETAIQPTLASLAELRAALIEYASDLEAPVARVDTPATPQTDSLADAAPEAGPNADHRAARRWEARQAVETVSALRRDLAAARDAQLGEADPATALPGAVHPEAIERIETEARSLLDALEAGTDGDGAPSDRLRALIDRLEEPSDRPRFVDQPPTFVFHDPPALPPYGAQP